MANVGTICSPGGHLIQLLWLLEAFEDDQIFLMTYSTPTLTKFTHPKIRKIYFIKYFGDTGLKMFFTLLWNGVTVFRIFLKERPEILFSTGAEIAIPAFLIGKYLFGTKLIFVETLSRVTTPSLTGKVLYHFSDLFLVQWESLLKQYGNRAIYRGGLI